MNSILADLRSCGNASRGEDLPKPEATCGLPQATVVPQYSRTLEGIAALAKIRPLLVMIEVGRMSRIVGRRRASPSFRPVTCKSAYLQRAQTQSKLQARPNSPRN